MQNDPEPTTWIQNHDDRWSFILPYVVLSILLSVLLSLFWLAFLIMLHFGLEWLRLKTLPPNRRLLGCLARTQLDWALLLAAVCMEVYLETAAGLAGAGQFARGLGRIAARFPGWQVAMRAILLSSDDALQLLRFQKESTPADTTFRVERVPLVLFVIAAILLLVAPLLLPIGVSDAIRIARDAFQPFP